MRKSRLFTPGPTPLSPRVMDALGRPLLHHRTPEFGEILTETRLNLQRIFKTENDVVVLSCSGSGGMEAAVCNLLDSSRRALAVSIGKFGERWAEICQAHDIPCQVLEKEYGHAASVEDIRRCLKADPSLEVVLIQGCETSTATSHDLAAIGRMIRSEFAQVLLVVDGITTAGCDRLDTDDWGLDIVISGSQKAFAVPPGLAFLSLSKRALTRMAEVASRGYYLDLVKEARLQAQGKTAYTSSVTLTTALLESTRAILEEGLESVVSQTEEMARACRAGLQALGFRLLSQAPSAACTAAFPPEGLEAASLSKRLQNRFGIKVAGGQGSLKGHIIRIAHLGYFDILDVFTILCALEMILQKPGQGVRAAMETLDSSVRTTPTP